MVDICLLGGRTKNQEAGSVAGNQTDESSLGEPRQPGRSLNANMPDPEEGVRLVKALVAIEDPAVRRDLIAYAEALARAKA